MWGPRRKGYWERESWIRFVSIRCHNSICHADWALREEGAWVEGPYVATECMLSPTCLQPPPTFQPPVPTGSTTSTANTVPGQTRTEQIDLIQRYNLAERLASPSQNPSSKSISQGAGKLHDGQAQWSNNKMERQALFQRRREEMVLNARKTMEEKEKQGHGERMVF